MVVCEGLWGAGLAVGAGPLLATDGSLEYGWVVALCGGVGTLVAALVTGFNRLFDANSVRKMREQDAVIKAYDGLIVKKDQQIDRLEQNGNRQQAGMEQQLDIIRRYQALHGNCREDLAHMYGIAQVQYQFACGLREEIIRLGGKPPAAPELPQWTPHGREEEEFLRNTSETSVKLTGEILRESVTDAKPPPRPDR
jgi:hypothetical protein